MSNFSIVTDEEKIYCFGSARQWIQRTYDEVANDVIEYARKYDFDLDTTPSVDIPDDIKKDIIKVGSEMLAEAWIDKLGVEL